MDEAARMLEQCAASPDDDEPRLVWADLVGGERGELVVLQCALARGGTPPEKTAQLRRRERELLDQHGMEWAGALASMATRWSFHRGFIESAHFADVSELAAAFSTQPLLSTIGVEWSAASAIDRTLRGLALHGAPGRVEAARLTELGSLRALSLSNVNQAVLPSVHELLASSPIEHLRLERHSVPPDRLELLLRAAPQVSMLRIARLERNDEPFDTRLLQRPLRALEVEVALDAELDALATHSLETLEHLRFAGARQPARTIAKLARFHRLRSLTFAGGTPDDNLQALVEAPGFASLRVLRIARYPSGDVVRDVVARFGAQLDLLEVPFETEIDSSLVAGEVHVRVYNTPEQLLHYEPRTIYEHVPVCVPRMAPCSVVRLDQHGTIWDIPALPADSRAVIGRHVEATIQINSPHLARRHAALHWREGRHVLEDLSSTNGTYFAGQRIREAPLADGDEFSVGDVLLQYFVGDSAHERAMEAAATVGGIEPHTRLLRNASPPVRVRVVDWDAMVKKHGVMIGNLVIRLLATALERELPGEKLWYVHHGCFGVESLDLARRIARPHAIAIEYATLDLELVVDMR